MRDISAEHTVFISFSKFFLQTEAFQCLHKGWWKPTVIFIFHVTQDT